MDYPIPSEATRDEIESIIIAWRAIKEARLAQDKLAGKLKEQEEEAKSFLLSSMMAQEIEGLVVQGYQTGVSKKEVNIVEDKGAFVTFIKETGAIELLQFQIAQGAVRERIENGEQIPGIGVMEKFDIFNRKS